MKGGNILEQESFNDNKNSGDDSKSILHIPLEKKKSSKKDTPLEKEMRRFNKLVKELHEHEKLHTQQQADDDKYRQLFLQRVHPILIEVAHTQMAFITKLEKVFNHDKFSKNVEKRFLEFTIPILHDAAAYLTVAQEKLDNYLNWQSTLFTKAEKAPLVVEENETAEDVENDEYKEDNHFRNEYKSNNNDLSDDVEKKSVADLYKELAKQIHPDLEQDETRKHAKEQLMKELTEAKDKEDVHAMLLIRQKADVINDSAVSEKSYSLQMLKMYNQSLKKKLEVLKRTINKNVFESFNSKANFFAHGKKQIPVEARIKNDIKNLKELQENLQHNTNIISSSAQLKELLDL